MQNGKYKVTIEVEINGMGDAQEALKGVADMIIEMHEAEETPDAVTFELLEEYDAEYEDEDDGIEELNFDKAS